MTFYTNYLRDDGFGSNFQTLLCTILYLEYNNLQFVYTDIPKIAHNYENDPLFVDKLVAYMAIKKNYMNINEVDDISNVITCDPGQVYRCVESNIDIYNKSLAMTKFKTFFYKEKTTPFDTQYFNVAIHIRRTNIQDDRDSSVTSIQYHINIIHRIYNDNLTKNIKFHIYSQGKIEDYQEIVNLTQYNIEFHLNEFVLDTFNAMVFADVLSTTVSSFSYVAGLLSNGIIYYTPFWHRPLSNWIIC